MKCKIMKQQGTPFKISEAYIFPLKIKFGKKNNYNGGRLEEAESGECLLLHLPGGASVRLVHARTWFKPAIANCFATDRSKAVTPRVLTFVNCLWRLF
jgi:hypothetical protein